MMSHKKVHSQGSIPFSWENKPGVCKTANRDQYPVDIGSQQEINKKSPSTFPLPQKPNGLLDSTKRIQAIQDMKIPLPPCPSQPPCRSTSGKGFRWQEDPFLVAYKECTKSEKIGKMPTSTENKKGVGSSSFSVRKSKSIFSCRSSTDVRDDNFVKLSQLPRLPSDRTRVLINTWM